MKKNVVYMFLPDAQLIFKERREYPRFTMTVKSDVCKFDEYELDKMAQIIKETSSNLLLMDLEKEASDKIIHTFSYKRKPLSVVVRKNKSDWEVCIGENILTM